MYPRYGHGQFQICKKNYTCPPARGGHGAGGVLVIPELTHLPVLVEPDQGQQISTQLWRHVGLKGVSPQALEVDLGGGGGGGLNSLGALPLAHVL